MDSVDAESGAAVGIGTLGVVGVRERDGDGAEFQSQRGVRLNRLVRLAVDTGRMSLAMTTSQRAHRQCGVS
jgi:hypothetical protein